MVDAKVLESIARLSRNPDFRVFMEEVSRRREAARDGLELATDQPLVGRHQGASIFAGELIELVADADKASRR